jgi:putative metalloenzyme radical SAM/SPASM domain maturase
MPETAQHPSLRPHPSKLFVEVTTRCNLHCPMCVKRAPRQHIADGDMSSETFARLTPTLPHLEALILNGIGEPLLHPRLEMFIAHARREMRAPAWIGFQTNAQLLDTERASSLVEAGVDRICISADAVSPDMFRQLRTGGEQEQIERAAAALHEAGRRAGRSISLGLEFVVMRDNLRELPELVHWAAGHSFSFMIATHMIAYQERMAAAAAFEPRTDQTLEVHREWRERIAADGVDLERYLHAFMRRKGYGSLSPEDQRVVDYYLEMTARASEQGVCIKKEWLAPGDDGALLRAVEAAFGEAEQVARREGIDLRLPAVVPRRARRCDFVEEGGAFVSWNGDVHPCYFLWHRYSCHVGGLAKHVKPLSFGNLAEGEALALWNGPPARAFREAVLRYDYPFCYDCTVALCDYQQDEDFTQDCYMSPVPCGACLWSTGVFQCLR